MSVTLIAPTLQEKTYECIRKMVVAGEIPAGHRIKENDLAQKLGASRVPVRESLIRLRSEGLLESKPRCGFVVRTFSKKDIIELYQVREAIEGIAARLAAENATSEQILEFIKIHEEYKNVAARVKDLSEEQIIRLSDQIVYLDEKLHHLVLLMSRNGKFESILSQVYIQKKMCLDLSSVAQIGIREHTYAYTLSIESHSKILSAIATHDGSLAEKEMRSHIAGALQAVLVLIKS